MIREPVASGRFYPNDKEALKKMVEAFIDSAEVKDKKAYGVVAPHAGYMFSGKTAGYSFKAISKARIKTAILLGPNHTGMGKAIALSHTVWRTPLGDVLPDNDIIDGLEKSGYAIDETAHKFERSIEVLLPFLQLNFDKTPNIVPICIAEYSIEACRNLADAIMGFADESVAVIASSDFSHYIDPKIIREIDDIAINRILNGNPEDFFCEITNRNMSVCGFLPISVLLFIHRSKGNRIELLDYSHSAMVYDMKEAVGYSSLAFYGK